MRTATHHELDTPFSFVHELNALQARAFEALSKPEQISTKPQPVGHIAVCKMTQRGEKSLVVLFFNDSTRRVLHVSSISDPICPQPPQDGMRSMELCSLITLHAAPTNTDSLDAILRSSLHENLLDIPAAQAI